MVLGSQHEGTRTPLPSEMHWWTKKERDKDTGKS